MAEWWSVVAVFWALYLVDGVSLGRRERLFLSSWRGGCSWRPRCIVELLFWRKDKRAKETAKPAVARPTRTAGLTQASWFFPPPWPWAYALALDDLPAGLAADGLGNWPAVSTARPPWTPDTLRAIRWEQVEAAATRGGWLMVGGRRVSPATEALDAAGLRHLAERLKPLAKKERAAAIAAWQARRFSVLRARRRLAVALHRTRGLALMNTLQTGGWLALSAGLLSGVFDPVPAAGQPFEPWRHLDALQTPWWILAAWLVFAHGLSVFDAWGLHRRLYPARKEERANLVFSALLLPAQALRLRAALLRPLGRGLAPLAGALAVGTPAAARAAAEATLRDAEHPMRPATLPALLAGIADEAAALTRPALERALADATAGGLAGVRPADLLAPPARPGPGVCAYCPRCGDEFVRADGVCPQGVKLKAIDGRTEEGGNLKPEDRGGEAAGVLTQRAQRPRKGRKG